MVIEDSVRWSEGDLVHYGDLEGLRSEGDSWEEVGDLLAERCVQVGKRDGTAGWDLPGLRGGD
jgi:hypothetical protein